MGVVEDKEQGPAVILDRTVFHPQGGGQPSDCGGYTINTGRFIRPAACSVAVSYVVIK